MIKHFTKQILSFLFALCILIGSVGDLSLFALAVPTSASQELTASDGQRYRVTVRYDTDSGIPANARLRVKELSAGSRRFARAVDAGAALLGRDAETLALARVFDISLRSPLLGLKYQPKTDVSVSIELLDETPGALADVGVVHFGREPEEMDATLNGSSLDFATGGFSVYAVLGGNTAPQTDPASYSIKYIFKYENGSDYNFPNWDGVLVNFQYVANGEAPFSPGTPSDDGLQQEGTVFYGWYGKDASGHWDEEATITADGVGAYVSGLTENGTEKILYPRYVHVLHVYYYDENAINAPGDTVYRIDVVEDVEAGDIYSTKNADGEYRINYIADSAKTAFIGWSPVAGQRTPEAVQDDGYVLPSSGVLKLYPVIADVYWVNFDKNDWVYSFVGDGQGDYTSTGEHVGDGNGAYTRKAGGASYVAPIYVLSGERLSDRVSVLSESVRPGYNFLSWQLPNGQPLGLNYRPTEDVTVKANWEPKTNQPYSVVFWTQVASDTPGMADDAKHYVYDRTITRQGTTESLVSLTANDRNPTSIGATARQFVFNEAKSNATATVAADGSTVLNVYFDRRDYTLTFIDPNSSGGSVYTPTTGTSGTQYGLVDGSYVELTLDNGVWKYRTGEYEETYVLSDSRSTGYYYIPDGNGGYEQVFLEWRGNYYSGGFYLNEYGYTPTTSHDDDYYYIENGSGGYERVYLYYNDGHWYRDRYWRGNRWRYTDEYTGTVYEYGRIEYTGPKYTLGQSEIMAEYTGTRYVRSSSSTVKTINALYGHNISDQFPIVGTNGTTYNQGQRWSPQNSSTFNQVLVWINLMPAESITFNLDIANHSVKHMYYYVEALGTEPSTVPRVTRNGRTYVQYVQIDARYNFLTEAEDYVDLEGFTKAGSNPTFSNGRADGTNFYMYYNRNSYNLEFWDGFSSNIQTLKNASNADITVSVPYQALMTAGQNAFTGAVGSASISYGGKTFSHTGYTFTGWYRDSACKQPMIETDASGNVTVNHWNDAMEAHNFKVYAGWEKMYYRVWIQPNGGVLSQSESTFFYADWGELVQQYADVEESRAYVESADGEYRYIYLSDPSGASAAAGESGLNGFRVAYYKKASELGWVYRYDEGGNVIGAFNEANHTDGKEYDYRPGVYTFIGWYQVKAPIDDNVAPPTSRAVSRLWSFGTPITANTAVRAMWRREGTYVITYDDHSLDSETNVDVGTTSQKPEDENVYVDLAQAVAPYAIHPDKENFVFAGWRTPDGEIHQPGETFMIYSDYAAETGGTSFTYVVTPVFKALTATTLMYDLNGVDTTLNSLGAPYGGDSDRPDGTCAVEYDYDNLALSNLTRNSRVTLSDGIDKNTGKRLTRDGYILTGWNSSPDLDAADAVHYELGKTYAISNSTTLYAEWTPICFDLSFRKTGEVIDMDTYASTFTPLNGATFQLTGTDFTTVAAVSATVEAGHAVDGETEGIVFFETVVPRSCTDLTLAETEAPYLPNGTMQRYKKDPDSYRIVWEAPNAPYTIEVIDGKHYVRAASVSIKNSLDESVTEIKNKWPSTTLRILKLDAEDDTKPLEDAQFTLTIQSGSSQIPFIRGDHPGGIYTTDANGNVVADLIAGTYTLTETTAPERYAPYAQSMTLTVTLDGTLTMTGGTAKPGTGEIPKPYAVIENVTATGDTSKTYQLTVGDLLNSVKISFLKIDGFGDPVAGAGFALYTDAACTVPLTVNGAAMTAISADGVSAKDLAGNVLEKGRVLFEGVPKGVWYMKETINPDATKYETNENVYIVPAGEANLLQTALAAYANLTQADINAQRGAFDAVNGVYELESAVFLYDAGTGLAAVVPDIHGCGVLNISKTQARVILRKIDDSYTTLPGAVFDLLRYDKTAVAEGIQSLDSGVIWVGSLPYGKYYLHETVTPDGYETLAGGDNWFSFTVDEQTDQIALRLTEAP